MDHKHHGCLAVKVKILILLSDFEQVEEVMSFMEESNKKQIELIENQEEADDQEEQKQELIKLYE